MAEVTEVIAEVAEEVADEATSVAEVSRALAPREVRFLVGGLGIGLIGGGIIGGLIIKRRLKTKYNDIAETEIGEMREHFKARLVAKEDKPDLSELSETVDNLGYSKPNAPTVKEPEDAAISVEETSVETDVVVGKEEVQEVAATEVNIFDLDTEKEPDEGWDYEAEIALRRPDRPYVIHVDECHESNYTEVSFVYYVGDDVLANERDEVIEDREVVGVDNLTKFGHGSKDRDIVFVRNDILGMEFELIKNDGNYAEIVHGFVQHADNFFRSHRRRRSTDDDE